MNDQMTEAERLLVGDRLKRTRNQQSLSVRQIAEMSGLSKTSVVQAEAGRTSRRSTYLKLAEAMGLHMDRLMQPGPSQEASYAIHRQADDSWFDLANFDEGKLPESAQTSRPARKTLASLKGVSPLNILASRLENGRIKPTILELYAPSPSRSHAGEEHVYVIEGVALVKVGASEIKLEAGESVTFWSSEPHSYAPAPDAKLPVRLLSVRVDT